MKNPGISFCVITGGHRPDMMEALIQSVIAQKIPAYEILVCGKYKNDPRVNYVETKEWAETAAVCKMRNFNAARARYDTVIILDDDVTFAPDWWKNMKRHADFDLAGCRGLDPLGNRWWDYQKIERGNPLASPELLDYGAEHPGSYISGYFMMMRREVWEAVKFDETRRNYQHDDIDFCHRAKDAGFTLKVFPDAVVTHHVDPRGRAENDRARAEFIEKNAAAATAEGEARKLLLLKDYAAAAQKYRALAALHGRFDDLYNLAFCEEHLGNADAALEWYRKAAAANAPSPARLAAAWFHIGYILRGGGKGEAAETALRKTIELQPDHKKAALLLDTLPAGKSGR
ncbi:MAG: glycosyltransferase [Nitrospinae bacterium]|nr:glycosyltransferase [Nitrospinota bacterium]